MVMGNGRAWKYVGIKRRYKGGVIKVEEWV